MPLPRRVRCTACDGVTARPDPFFYEWRQRRFTIFRCGACTHQFVFPSITADDQDRIYGDEYFSRDGDWVCGIFKAGYLEAEQQLREEARSIIGMLPPPPGKLLDIGCAGGVFLDEARKQGFEVCGIEINQSMANHARTTYNLDVRTTRIEQIPPTEWQGAFDVVTLLDCLEHLPEPLAAMKSISRWLRPGGVVFIRGPLSDSAVGRIKEWARRIVGIQKRLPGYPLDANMFNRSSFAGMLTASGFEKPQWFGATPIFANLLARKR